MFIKRLHIENFKCFEDKTLDHLAVPNGSPGSGLNILIGENGNGKTTILESLNYLTLNGYSVENKLDINDFYDFRKDIKITADIEDYVCNSTIDFYSSYHFVSNGIEFTAKSRKVKEKNKILSSSFDSHSHFRIKSNYIDSKKQEKGAVDSRDKLFNNAYIKEDGLNIFYFDKNRNRQISTGNYKTTFEKILDDLTWRFIKGLDPSNESKILNNITGEYFKSIEEITNSNAGAKTIQDLMEFFGVQEFSKIKIELIKLLSPFKNAFYSLRNENSLKQIQVSELGSGVEITLTILLLKNIASASKGKLVYMIDEPELHLHPKAQEKLIELLIQESKDKQIFISTHSPYMFKGTFGLGANLMILRRNSEGKIEIQNTNTEEWGLFGKESPTWGEINWYAYNLSTVEFHNELYGFLQAKAIGEDESNYHEMAFDNWLRSKGFDQNKRWIKETKGGITPPLARTVPTYIRNFIHHPENSKNSPFSKEELNHSINELIKCIKSLSK